MLGACFQNGNLRPGDHFYLTDINMHYKVSRVFLILNLEKVLISAAIALLQLRGVSFIVRARNDIKQILWIPREPLFLLK